MEKFIWTEDYSVGIKEIDEQHKRFFWIANSIGDLMAKDSSKSEILGVLENLKNYASSHFETEEGYFDKFVYPEALKHIEEHKAYKEKISKFIGQAEDGNTDLKYLPLEIAAYSNAWLSTHILLIDKKYTKFFNEHGLK